MSNTSESTIAISLLVAREAGKELFEIVGGNSHSRLLNTTKYTTRFGQLVKEWTENTSSSMIIDLEEVQSERFYRQVLYYLKAYSLRGCPQLRTLGSCNL